MIFRADAPVGVMVVRITRGGAGRVTNQVATMLIAEPRTAAASGVAHLHNGRCTLVPEIAGAVQGEEAIVSSSALRSPTACHRPFGCFSRHRRIRSKRRGFRF